MYYAYRHLDSKNNIIYVGKTIDIHKRQKTYLNNKSHTCEEHCKEIAKIEYIMLKSKVEMDIKELYYISKWKPKYNTQNKKDEDLTLLINEEKVWNNYKVKPKLEMKIYNKYIIPTEGVIELKLLENSNVDKRTKRAIANNILRNTDTSWNENREEFYIKLSKYIGDELGLIGF